MSGPGDLAARVPDALATLWPGVDLFGIGLFALTGAVMAARHRQTFVTASFFALVTGVGGGSVRDLLIGAPVFWVHDPWIALLCIGVALMVWLTPMRWWDERVIDWFDAFGLAVYAVYGTAKALQHGIPPVPAMLMGVITACVGGIIRDMLAGVPSIIIRPELYVTAAALAAGLYGLLTGLEVARPLAGLIAIGAGFALRGAAIRWRIALPAYGRGAERKDDAP